MPRVGWAALVSAIALVGIGPPLEAERSPTERVEIRRDTFGVPHILAEDEEAGGFGFGYAMAEDHAVELGRRYLQARGEGARHFGAGELDSDLAMRRFDNRDAARRALDDDIGGRFRRWLEGFAAGVNAYVSEHRDTLPAWMPAVEPSDPLAYGRMFAVLAASRPPGRLLQKYGAAAPPLAPPPIDEAGSNAFALAGKKTTSGYPILLGNPHLGWSALYWEAHVTVPERINFYGSTLVGIPVLRAGFNDRLGYVQTNNAPDLEDIYALPLVAGQPGTFVHRGREQVIERRTISAEMRQADGSVVTQPREYEETTLGPVVHRTADHVFVLRSVNLEWWRQYEGFFELLRARSLGDFRRTLGRRLAVTSNYTYADVDGNIVYAWNARLPRRGDDEVDYTVDVPGDTGRLFWKGIHRATDLPWLVNPRGGYVQNANNPPWWTSLRDAIDPTDYPQYIERGQLSLRAQLVLEALDATRTFSPDQVRELKFTTRVLAAERLLPDLLAAAQAVAAPSEALRDGLATLTAWDRRVSATSRGAVLFERFMDVHEQEQQDRFSDRYAAPDAKFVLGAGPHSGPGHAERAKADTVNQPRALPGYQGQSPWLVPWDPHEPMTTPRGLANPPAALAALERAVTEVRQQHGSERVAWGEVHRFRFGDVDLPGDGASGRHGVFRVVTFQDSGGGTRIAGHVVPGQPLAGFGDAWILMVHFTKPVTAWSVLAYGQTTNLDSPHSRDQIRLFAHHQLRPVWFSEEAIAAHLERRYRPASR
jgi:acyl-homoserine-lactone acylase